MTRFLLSVSALMLLSASAHAQTQGQATNWMNMANDVMNSPTGQQMLQSMTGAKTATTTTTTSASTANNIQASSGLKEALSIGTNNVVSQLGKTGGFSADPKIHIPLPLPLQKMSKTMTRMGMGTMSTDLENRMNEAAEQAMPKAATLFASAIQKMTIQDAQAIVKGPNTAATQYLRKTMGTQLATDMQPVVADQLSQAGAIQAYDAMAGQMPMMGSMAGSMKNSLNSYVANKAVDGIFYYVGQQEAAIRTDPAKQTTALLKNVFGTAAK